MKLKPPIAAADKKQDQISLILTVCAMGTVAVYWACWCKDRKRQSGPGAGFAWPSLEPVPRSARSLHSLLLLNTYQRLEH